MMSTTCCYPSLRPSTSGQIEPPSSRPSRPRVPRGEVPYPTSLLQVRAIMLGHRQASLGDHVMSGRRVFAFQLEVLELCANRV
jgi:hypothetical protein